MQKGDWFYLKGINGIDTESTALGDSQILAYAMITFVWWSQRRETDSYLE